MHATTCMYLYILLLQIVCYQDMQDDIEPAPLDRQLVVYNPPQFLQPLQEREKRVVFGGYEWVIKQDWDGVGVAAVVWEPVSRSEIILMLATFPVTL